MSYTKNILNAVTYANTQKKKDEPFNLAALSVDQVARMTENEPTVGQINQLKRLGVTEHDIAQLNRYTASQEIERIMQKQAAEPVHAWLKEKLLKWSGVTEETIEGITHGEALAVHKKLREHYYPKQQILKDKIEEEI